MYQTIDHKRYVGGDDITLDIYHLELWQQARELLKNALDFMSLEMLDNQMIRCTS